MRGVIRQHRVPVGLADGTRNHSMPSIRANPRFDDVGVNRDLSLNARSGQDTARLPLNGIIRFRISKVIMTSDP